MRVVQGLEGSLFRGLDSGSLSTFALPGLLSMQCKVEGLPQ